MGIGDDGSCNRVGFRRNVAADCPRWGGVYEHQMSHDVCGLSRAKYHRVRCTMKDWPRYFPSRPLICVRARVHECSIWLFMFVAVCLVAASCQASSMQPVVS